MNVSNFKGAAPFPTTANLARKTGVNFNSQTHITPLDNVLNYKNEGVLLRFMDEFGIGKNDATRIFEDMLRWLWLNALHTVELKNGTKGIPGRLGIRAEQLVIDEMWHIFMIYTEDYRNFCEKHFGFFIHHAPNDAPKESLSAENLESYLIQYLTYVHHHLGHATMCRWFEEYGEKYSSEILYRQRILVLQNKIRQLVE